LYIPLKKLQRDWECYRSIRAYIQQMFQNVMNWMQFIAKGDICSPIIKVEITPVLFEIRLETPSINVN